MCVIPSSLDVLICSLFTPSIMMKNESESRPFLEYSDNESARSGGGDVGVIVSESSESSKRAIRRSNRLARDLFVFLIASLLWLGAIVFFLPWLTTSIDTYNDNPTRPLQSGGGGAAVNYRLHNLTSNAHFETCGNSTAEAQQKGCRYDTLLNHWVPAACMDQEWVDEYKDDDSWAAFAEYVPDPHLSRLYIYIYIVRRTDPNNTRLLSANLTQRLSQEDMGERDHYYTSIRDHVNHCAWLWRKQFWTLFEDRNVFDGVIVNTYHTEHCAQFLSELMSMNRTEPTLVRVGFSGCWIRDENSEL